MANASLVAASRGELDPKEIKRLDREKWVGGSVGKVTKGGLQ